MKCKKYKSEKEFFKNSEWKGVWGKGLDSYCKKCTYTKRKISERKRKKRWTKYLPKNPKCEICRKKLYYFSEKKSKRVHFDHPQDNLPIKYQPTTWLRGYNPSFKNRKIWNSCDFGILCAGCNGFLPTKNRIQWIEKINKYIFGKKWKFAFRN